MTKKEDRFFILDRPEIINTRYYVKRFLIPFLDIFYFFLLFLYKGKSHVAEKKYIISICAIFKDEAHNMREWIEYHRIVGVDHFYLYNNFSSDNFSEVLDPFIANGLVTLIEWPMEKGQMKAYEHCFVNYKNDSKWISFLDLDEFIVPIKTESLKIWLRKFDIFPCVLVYWKMFGSSGLVEGDKGKLTIEQYIVSWEKLVNIGKVFWNTDFIITDFSSMHIMLTSVKVLGRTIMIPPINQFRKFIRGNYHRHGNYKENDIQINHYWSKSYKDSVIDKFRRGDAFTGGIGPNRNLKSFMYHEHKNISSDYKIYKYLIELKIALGLTSFLEK